MPFREGATIPLASADNHPSHLSIPAQAGVRKIDIQGDPQRTR